MKPVTWLRAAVLATLTLGGFLALGFARDYASDAPGYSSLLTASNEFQALFGTAFDVYMMKTVDHAEFPTELYFADLLRLVPQQFLAFEKIDPSTWYLAQRSTEDPSRAGLMFGAMAEAIIALDWLSLFLQASFVGCVLGLVHRWYVLRKERFLATVAYIWLCVEVYYTFRASTLYILVWVVYRLLPTLLFLWIGTIVLRKAAMQSAAARHI